MNLIQSLIHGGFVNALGWAILHSLWQGALAALLLISFLSFVNKNSSKIRSLAAAAAQLVIIISFAFTFAYILQNSAAQEGAENAMYTGAVIHHQSLSGDAGVITRNTAGDYFILRSEFTNYIASHLSSIVFLWTVGIILLSLKFMWSLILIRKIKNYGIIPIDYEWHNKLNLFRRNLNIIKHVGLFESIAVNVPSVVGFFKPVILMPVGSVTGMSSKQVEAIIAHELAHIYRKDFLINMFQTIAETIFFYNPAVWWISGILREEREKDCDDIAVRLTGDRITYVKALTTVEETIMNRSSLAQSLLGKKKYLLKRVQRILIDSELKTSFAERLLGALIIAFIAGSAIVYAGTGKYSVDIKYFSRDSVKNTQKTETGIPLPPAKLLSQEQGKAPAAPAYPLPPNNITETGTPPAAPLLPNNNTLPPAAPAAPAIDTGKAFENDTVITKIIEIKEDSSGTGKDTMITVNKNIKRIIHEELNKERKDAEKDSSKVKYIKEIIKESSGHKMKISEKEEKRVKEKEEQILKKEQRVKEYETQMRKKEIRIKEKEADIKNHQTLLKLKEDKIEKSIKAELLKDGLIKTSRSGLSFDLSKDALIVDGKKQNDVLLNKYIKLIEEQTGNKLRDNEHFKIDIKIK